VRFHALFIMVPMFRLLGFSMVIAIDDETTLLSVQQSVHQRVQQIHASSTDLELATAQMISTLHKTSDNVQCLARANAQCWGGLSQCADSLGTCCEHGRDVFEPVASFLEGTVGNTSVSSVVHFADDAAKEWHATASHLRHEQQELNAVADSNSIVDSVQHTKVLVQEIGVQAEEDNRLFHNLAQNCDEWTVFTSTGVCGPLHKFEEEMVGHVEGAQSDLVKLQELHAEVKTLPELALIQGRHATSITLGDKLSAKAISTLQNLLNHQLAIQDQIHNECYKYGSISGDLLVKAKKVPGLASSLANTQAAVDDIVAGAATTCGD